MAAAMQAPDGCPSDRAGYRFSLPIGPRVAGLCQAMAVPLDMQIMSKRMERNHDVPLLRGRPANWMACRSGWYGPDKG